METAMESAVKNAKDLTHQTASGSDTINRVDEQRQRDQQVTRTVDCGRCGGRHDPQQCKFRDVECFVCHKKGHIARKCRSRQKGHGKSRRGDEVPNSGKTSNYLNREEEAEEEVESNYTIYSLGRQKTEPYVVEVLLNEESVKMEVDTGAAMSVISEDTFRALKKKYPCLELCESKVRLHTYTGEQVKVAGQFKTSVKYEEQEIVPVLVIQGKGPNLIGRNWLQKIKLNWRNIFQLEEANTTNTTTQRVEELVQKYEQVFQEGLGTFTGPKAKIHVAADAKPIYCKARPVPYSLKKESRGRIRKTASGRDGRASSVCRVGSANRTGC